MMSELIRYLRNYTLVTHIASYLTCLLGFLFSSKESCKVSLNQDIRINKKIKMKKFNQTKQHTCNKKSFTRLVPNSKIDKDILVMDHSRQARPPTL